MEETEIDGLHLTLILSINSKVLLKKPDTIFFIIPKILTETMNMLNESITNLLFREEPEEVKQPLYRSKFSDAVREEVKRRKLCHRTMGFPADFPRTPPEEYLKKRTRMVKRPVVAVEKPSPATSRIPTREEWIKISEGPKDNFIVRNIRNAVKSTPKITPYRDYNEVFCKKVAHRAYCLPRYVTKEGFGKVPKYIIKEKEKQERERKKIEEEKKKVVEEPICRLVPPEERQKLLDGLKQTWADMQKEYQLLPMITDTPPKIKKKAKLEKDLMELENDIKLVDQYDIIYVCDSERLKKQWGSMKTCP